MKLFAALLVLCLPVIAAADEPAPEPLIPVAILGSSPVLDARADEWRGDAGTVLPLHPSTTEAASVIDARELLLKVGRFDDQVLVYVEWRDDQPDLLHKPYVWDDMSGRYVRGVEREDRLALQFEISGDYSTDWLSGNQFVADMWHWKASRSNPLGLAHDKLTRISATKLLRSYRTQDKQGRPLYILRESDAGDPLYRTLLYGRKDQPVMPKYVLAQAPSGSVADVRAYGEWRDGFWRVELLRKLDTGHDDDVRFARGKMVRAGIAVFDRSENPDHMLTQTLRIQF
ncbi:ethylbenzene dehydrogenase-related protein [Motiliproteus sediminis]|uniref:ethylbenzene dehydrogenase-related protein n=1 Tax=Motiliproteus sediminis TaxID=1468178 RepID=UPI001AEF6D4F|nr:ethylbenzene dehydrogenase-related protein [Motiliproteus sediminis]